MSRSPEKIEVVWRARTEPEAEMIVAVLRGAGVYAQTEGGLTSALRAEAPGEVKVLVRGRDLSRARAILEAHRPHR